MIMIIILIIIIIIILKTNLNKIITKNKLAVVRLIHFNLLTTHVNR